MAFTSNALVPELAISNLEKSLFFYVNLIGFSIAYDRKEEGFAFLCLGETQIMIDVIDKGRAWKTADLIYPFGRGINLQIKVKSIRPLLDKLSDNMIVLFQQTEEKWYRKGAVEIGHKQFLVMDPDGYLLRFVEDIGERQI